jgi:hypothetical protein
VGVWAQEQVRCLTLQNHTSDETLPSRKQDLRRKNQTDVTSALVLSFAVDDDPVRARVVDEIAPALSKYPIVVSLLVVAVGIERVINKALQWT